VKDLLRGVNNYLPCKYAKYIYRDELLIEEQFYSFDGKLDENTNGVAIVRYKRYNDKTRFAEIKETSYFDSQGVPVISKATDCHTIVNQYDDNDNKISVSYLDIYDKPIPIWKSNQAEIRYFYDSLNRLIKLEIHNLNKDITSNNYGVAISEIEYKYGYKVKDSRFDSLHRPISASAIGDGTSIIHYVYDSNGNEILENYFDENGNPVKNHFGVHEIKNKYPASNMLLEMSFFDKSGEPSVDRDKNHTLRYVYDSVGRIIQTSGYDIETKPLKNLVEEVYMTKYMYDESDRKFSVSYWKDSVTKMSSWDGVYEQRTSFNEDGQPVEYNYLDQNGKPFITSEGSSKVRLIYDSYGKLGERQFLCSDTLSMKKRGLTKDYSVIRYKHDGNGRTNELTFFNNEHQPVNATISLDEPFFAHRIVFIYQGNRIVQQVCFGVDGDTPVKIIDCLNSDFISVNGTSEGRKNEN
jgi:hypothetical protein